MELKELVYKMLTEGTGKALCDSGGAYGRYWERNQERSLKDFINDKQVTWEIYKGEVNFTISVFHYLTNVEYFELDVICDEFNAMSVKDWDSEIYGVSKAGEKWLKAHGKIGQSFNTCNGECMLSQTLQGTNIIINDKHYVLYQIHNGCDVRGGYTDAKLFMLRDEFIPPVTDVRGIVDGKQVSSDYNGCSLTYDDNDKEVVAKDDSKIELHI